MSKRYIVTLAAEERRELEELTRSGKAAARAITHARSRTRVSCSRRMVPRVDRGGRMNGLPTPWM